MQAEDGTQATYDAVAQHYADEYADDLAEKVVDRALLTAFAELARRSSPTPHVGDLGCGPGFEAAHLAGLGLRVTGVDLSPGMIAEAKRRHDAAIDWQVGSLLELPIASGSLDGAVAIYSIIHLVPDDRPRAYAELARVVRAGAPLLVAFHVSADGFPAGSRRQLDEWWGERVSLVGHFIATEDVVAGLEAVGFDVVARVERGPVTPAEFPSRRCYLLATRRAPST